MHQRPSGCLGNPTCIGNIKNYQNAPDADIEGATLRSYLRRTFACVPLVATLFVAAPGNATIVIDNFIVGSETDFFGDYESEVLDDVFVLPGARYGERFAGMTASGRIEILLGFPTAPLTLLAGDPGNNLMFGDATGGVSILMGCAMSGSNLCPNRRAAGEGALSIQFQEATDVRVWFAELAFVCPFS